jgi:beta-lactamase regulating signal transducer with metallopeptidase domain
MIEALVHASIRGAVVVGVVWGVCRLFPALPAATRTWLWWCASASFLVALGWTAPVALEVLAPQRASREVQDTHHVDTAGVASTPLASETLARLQASTASSVTTQNPRLTWLDGLAAIWLAGALVSGAIGARRWREVVRLLRTSQPASSAVEATTAELAERLGIRHPPRVRLHSAVDVPYIVGLWRPTIVLPASPRDDSSEAVRMSICHELAHVVRRDLWLGWVPALAERIFFFHPLARAAASEYALSREAACDAVVVETLAIAPGRYGRWLVDLGAARRTSGLVVAGASGPGDHLRRRLLMLERIRVRTRRTRLLAVAIVVLIAVVVVPWRLVARQPTSASRDIALASAIASPAEAQEEQLTPTMPATTAVQPPTPVEPVTAPLPQTATPTLQPCATTTPVHARAPDDPNASPVTGWWHMSADKALWVPSSPPGEATTGLGRYWLRPAGQGLTVRGRRLDGDAPPVLMVEGQGDGYWTNGFFFGGPSIPSEGCWEFEVTSGSSRVRFVTEIHTRFEAFAERPQTRVTFENEVGRIESGGTSLAVTAIVIEDPATRTRRLGGARLDLRDATRAVTLYEPFERLEGTRGTLERAAAGEFPSMVYAIGGTHNITPGEFLTIRGRAHTFTFASHTHVDAARLLVAAGDALRAQLR